MKTFSIGKQKLESDNGNYFDIFEALNDKPVSTYQMEGQNKKSFNWGFLAGVLFSAVFWIAVIYLLK